MRYEVRCCCIPEKLLGYLHAPEDVRDWVWPVKTPMPWTRITNAEQLNAPITHIQLRIEKICVNGHCYLAIKAEGVEIETLRRVAGFEEA